MSPRRLREPAERPEVRIVAPPGQPTPLVPPPRALERGDRLAVHHSTVYGADVEVEVWFPFIFDGWRDFGGRRYMALQPAIPWGTPHHITRWSFGPPTGLQADLGTTFVAYASDVPFNHFCPDCRGACWSKRGEPCLTCNGIGWMPYNPFGPEPVQRVRHHLRNEGALPGYVRTLEQMEAHGRLEPMLVVGFDRPPSSGHSGSPVTFHTMPRVIVERVMREPDPDKVLTFTRDHLGRIVEVLEDGTRVVLS